MMFYMNLVSCVNDVTACFALSSLIISASKHFSLTSSRASQLSGNVTLDIFIRKYFHEKHQFNMLLTREVLRTLCASKTNLLMNHLIY